MTGGVSIFGFRKNRRIALTRVRRIALCAIRSLGIPGEVEIVFANPKLMRRLNLMYRRKRKAADVLSFSYPGGTPSGQVFLDRTAVNTPDKLTRLLVHAIVHLGGYEHRTARGRRRMEKKEKEILRNESLYLRT